MSLAKTNNPIAIIGAVRTPMGCFQGLLSTIPAPELGAAAIKAAVEQAGLSAEDVQEVIMGCVLPAGQGQAPARQASIKAGIPLGTGSTTINKMCGSGMKSVMLAHDMLLAGTNEVMVAGGMESMSNAPYLLPKVRSGLRMGHSQALDHMYFDGLEDCFGKGGLMGTFAEACADKYQFTREQQDKFAITSLLRAQKATESGAFNAEIIPIIVKSREEETLVQMDEQPYKSDLDKIPGMRPAFRKDGTVTAANSSSISDGAAALTLMRMSEVKKRGLKPLAVIHGHSTFSQAPEWFTTAPIGAIKALLEELSWRVVDVDLFEVNEAFAAVTMAAIHDLELPDERVNIHGGACALGHPIGASGARIIVTLLYALRHHGLETGIASLCIGGGEATAIAIELV